MKKINRLYWTFTGLLIPILGIGSVFDLMQHPDSVKIITSLGFPAYMVPFLGAGRLLALATIVLSHFKRLKEWAYAGLTFDIIAALYSIIAFGNPPTHLIFPGTGLLVLLSSYIFYHKRQQLFTKSSA